MARKIWTLKATLVSGPGFDGEECTRFIEVDAAATNLYDLHVALMDAIHFGDDQDFAFFRAGRKPARRTYLPAGANPEEDGIDTDLYEDIPLRDALPAALKPAAKKAPAKKAPAKKAPTKKTPSGKTPAKAAAPEELYYLYNLEDKWIFRITLEPGEKAPEPGEDYPLVLDHLNIGPDPVETPGLDDYADAEEGFEFNQARRADREIRDRALRDDGDDGDGDDEGNAFARRDDDDFFDDDEDDDLGEDEDDDEDRDPFFDDEDDEGGGTLFGHGPGRSSPGSDYDYSPDDQW